MEAEHQSGHSSDRENDTFEDATPATDVADASEMAASNSHTRSLIGRRSSSGSRSTSTKRDSDAPAVVSPVPVPVEEEAVAEPSEPFDFHNADIDDDFHDVDDEDYLKDRESEVPPGPKSPLPKSHRISTQDMAAMDDVNLNEEGKKSRQNSYSSTVASLSPKPQRDSNDSLPQVFANPVPEVQQPPPPPPPKEPPAPTPPPKRSLTSPFAWLSRGSSEKKQSPSPKAGSRRGTNASTFTLGSNPELKIGDGEESVGTRSHRSSRNSLKDRFKFLRMREEAGIPIEEGEEHLNGGLKPEKRSASFSVMSTDESEGAPDMARVASSPGTMTTPAINPHLAPGTVSGIATAPPENPPPVDWDLWQSVVYEGPAAVARTSAEELNEAIQSGIPQAIRGVVWQVLAQSKNEDLEVVYRELVARGTDKEKTTSNAPQLSRQENPSGTQTPNGAQTTNGLQHKDSVTSSASSIHSGYSTPATTATGGGVGSPTSNGNDPQAVNGASAALLEARKKKEKEDAIALSKLEKQIKRDMGARTSYSKYLMAAGLQDGLFGLCKAYALFDEAVGYPQGVNFVAMPLLFNMPEEEAFCLLVKMMNQYGLRDMFIQDMPGLHLHLYQFERLLEDFEPALYCHLHRRGVTPQLYATQWFLTLFAYRFPLQLVLRIYDLILSEGLESAILKFGIVLMQKNSETLLGMRDMGHLTTFLKERIFDVYIDKSPSQSSLLESGFFGSAGGVDKEVYRADMMVQDACSIKITSEMLAQYTLEWKEQQNAEKARECELDNLKQSVASLSLKVRTLEERAEKSDTEHVAIASELVRTKVENETLQDENESFKTQAQELRKLLDTQAEQIEARMHSEMEIVMKRNMEVQEENRSLEEQLSDMERVLVETKMQYAQVNSDHEMLKQRWSSVQTLLNSG
ncbi:uncharacterized protein K452DRAFT_168062 [Aplosporella prunicola CBS 121167]|uniref:GTPase-activating protein GYP5 n=1 Tax=Aplosporella prunicola CBS 121167 TaxID=1176127 RepID=A0A6A6BGF7_9PEZI|nr:uncharacterized protein K452DRAFT_168062 [Aplosporella prunicola CBS 121167]KAF2143252.1 hypothetical protein K452DRAFT_168062 [Aplosporella prunicola CBS 121167]